MSWSHDGASTTSTAGSPTTTTSPAATPSEPVTLRGLWVGKINDQQLYLTITKVDGAAVTATAEFKGADGFVHLDLRGTYDADTGKLELTDPYDGGVFRGELKDARLAGGAVVKPGQPQVSWSTAKR